jgi:hypothetical protein
LALTGNSEISTDEYKSSELKHYQCDDKKGEARCKTDEKPKDRIFQCSTTLNISKQSSGDLLQDPIPPKTEKKILVITEKIPVSITGLQPGLKLGTYVTCKSK